MGVSFYRRGLSGSDALDGRGCRLSFSHEVCGQHHSGSAQPRFAMHGHCTSATVASVDKLHEAENLFSSWGRSIRHWQAEKRKTGGTPNRCVAWEVEQGNDSSNARLTQLRQLIFKLGQGAPSVQPARRVDERHWHSGQKAWNDPVEGSGTHANYFLVAGIFGRRAIPS